MVRASLLLLATVAGVASFGYVDPGMMSGCPSADSYSCIEMTGTGRFFDTASHMCLDDSCMASSYDEASCMAMMDSGCYYASGDAAMGLCYAGPCAQSNMGDAGASCPTYGGGCYWYTTIPGYESGVCATDVCSVSTLTDQATCEATDPGPASYCTWDGGNCYMM